MTAMLHPPLSAVRRLVALALAEDLEPLGDLSAALVAEDDRANGAIVARADGVVAGTACVDEAYEQLGGHVEVNWRRVEGQRVSAGEAVADIKGPLRSVLTGERTALNFLGHLSGVATLTSRFVDAVGPTSGVVVWDTRKTLPGLRSLQKAAVRAGGGRNHRGNLSEWVMLKDNHLAHLGIEKGIERARDLWPGRTIHVECENADQALCAAAAGAGALLLDNMSPTEVAACVAALVDAGLRDRVLIEASGGVTLESAGAFATAGVDCISVGALTASAPVLDLGLDLLASPGP